MDYKGTVNLPQTPFPMRGDLLRSQERMLRRWQAQSIYRSILEDRRDARPFLIHDGPPYASGQMHLGIGMNKVLKDIVAKYHAMNDRRVPFVPGWDCHGLPIELEVRRQLEAEDTSRSRREIRGLCAKSAQRYVKRQTRQFELLGIFADWERPYLTMSSSYEASVLSVLAKMVAKGYVERDLRPITWCTTCRTALADAEVEYPAVPGPSLWIYFDGEDLAQAVGAPPDQSCSLLVWTTTPWSLPGNVAVGVHPDLTYGVFELTDQAGQTRIVVVLESRARETFEALEVAGRKIGVVAAADLAGQRVSHPVFDRQVPVIRADYVSDETGTGMVHLAPAHGVEDFHQARQHRLKIVSPIDEQGRFTDEAPGLEGLELEEAVEKILEMMRQRGSLAALGRREHEHPHCRRCEQPAIHRATAQWFVRVDHVEPGQTRSLRDRALLEADVTQWLPAASRARIRGMLAERPDWCISRQRAWGVPIPAFVCGGCGEEVLDVAAIRQVRDQVAENGSTIWFERDARELVPPGLSCPGCGGKDWAKGEDILDVWFESGASWNPVLVADNRGNFPADLYVEGSDQHRGWFQLSLLTALASRGKAPYERVLTHGFVLNRDKLPMSRSRGDRITLESALEEVPADLIRLRFASADVSSDVSLSLEDLRSIEPEYRALRNTFRFLLGSLHEFVPRQHSVHLDDLHPLDLWVLCSFHRLVHQVDEAFASYRFHIAVQQIVEHCNETLSKLYFDVLKDRLYCEAPDSHLRRSAQTVLHSVLVGLVKLLAPVLPYTCEEVWDLTPGHGDCLSVHLSRWPKSDERLAHTRKALEIEKAYARLSGLRDAVKPALEKLREEKVIGEDTEALVSLHLDGGAESLLGVLEWNDVRDFLRVSEVLEAPDTEALEAVAGLPGVAFGVAASPHAVCVRCRRRDPTCGSDDEHPQLCQRCSEVVRALDAVPDYAPPRQAVITPSTRPADIAAVLRAKDVRRVALLTEDGVCRPYALHPPSQEVRILEELQPLADYINASPDFRRHAAILLGLGEHTDVLFGIGIHHLKHGTPLGGTREFAYPRVGDMIDNLLRLSWGMSVKNAIAELPHGGGKSIIDTCGWDLKIQRELRRGIYRDFGQFVASLFGRYICAEDVGNTNADTREMLYACRHVMCLSQGVGGSGNPSRFTSLAAWAAVKAGWKFLTGSTSFAGLTVSLQGCGNVGRNFVSLLIEADPEISRLKVADRDPEQIEVIRNLLLKKDKVDILEVVSSLDPKLAEGGSYVEREDESGKDYILFSPCDILIPAAVGNVIDPDNVARLDCKVILPISNNVYSDNDTVAQALLERGIVDVVENNVNWGGALAAASEILGYDETNVGKACVEAFDKTLALLEEARDRGVPPWELIKERASRRIFNEVHPAVDAARKYRFIGNVSDGFPGWVKEKWLCNVVDVESDEFPAFSTSLAPWL